MASPLVLELASQQPWSQETSPEEAAGVPSKTPALISPQQAGARAVGAAHTLESWSFSVYSRPRGQEWAYAARAL